MTDSKRKEPMATVADSNMGASFRSKIEAIAAAESEPNKAANYESAREENLAKIIDTVRITKPQNALPFYAGGPPKNAPIEMNPAAEVHFKFKESVLGLIRGEQRSEGLAHTFSKAVEHTIERIVGSSSVIYTGYDINGIVINFNMKNAVKESDYQDALQAAKAELRTPGEEIKSRNIADKLAKNVAKRLIPLVEEKLAPLQELIAAAKQSEGPKR